MSKNKKSFWDFFASVKLAIFCFISLAFGFIIGSVIPQNKAPHFYTEKYGETISDIFQLLNIPDTYHSWWFVSLIILFCINLTICSIERLPTVWKIVTLDNLDTKVDRLAKMTPRNQYRTALPKHEALLQVEQTLINAGWKPRQGETEGGTLIFAQKTPWVRFGVYIIHFSILVIFLGGLIGMLFGSDGSLMLREKGTTPIYFERGTDKKIPFGFDLHIDDFSITYYYNGTPKELKTELIFIEGDQKLKKSIAVNESLYYKGYTFYQSTHKAMNEYWITIQNINTGARRTFSVKPEQQYKWQEAGISFAIINLQPPDSLGKYKLNIILSAGKGMPSVFWLDGENEVTVGLADTVYAFRSEQVMATGLSVQKDPGVWPVYTGCTLMLLGLFVAFFLSHKRLWVYISKKEDVTKILIAGSSNKNKAGFENIFYTLLEKLEKNETLQLSKE